MAASFYVRIQGRILGPFDNSQLASLRDRGQLKQFHEISSDQQTWYPASNFSELFPSGGPALGGASPVPPKRDSNRGGTISQPPRDRDRDRDRDRNRGREPEQDYPNEGSDYPEDYPPEDDYDDDRPRKGFPWLLVIGLIVLLGGGTALVLVLTSGKGGGKKEGGNLITGFEEAKLNRAVGNVICGAEIIFADGELVEIPKSSGSAFVISPNGYLLTNKHVVEGIQQDLRSAELKKKNDSLNIVHTPKVWVFFEQRRAKAEIVYISDDFDMAILKVDVETPYVFQLSTKDEFPRNTKVYAAGFPGAAGGVISLDEAIKKQGAAKVLYPKVELYYNKRDFSFSSSEGPISRVFSEERGRVWIQHGLNTIHGYSGSALFGDDGVVLGINTRVANANVSKDFQIAPGIGYALTMPQMRKEIDRHVKDVVWK